MLDYEREKNRLNDENAKLALANQKLREENDVLRGDKDELRYRFIKLYGVFNGFGHIRIVHQIIALDRIY